MSDSNFTVQLQGINLPDNIKTKIEEQFRSIVLSEITAANVLGEKKLVIDKLINRGIGGDLGGGPRGLVGRIE